MLDKLWHGLQAVGRAWPLAPTGTVAAIMEGPMILKTAAVPSKLTPVAPVRFVPRMSIAVPTGPELGSIDDAHRHAV
jgi:hypothetical protein